MIISDAAVAASFYPRARSRHNGSRRAILVNSSVGNLSFQPTICCGVKNQPKTTAGSTLYRVNLPRFRGHLEIGDNAYGVPHGTFAI